MHFDIESALAIVGGEALEEAKKQAKAQNITLDVGYTQDKSKISYCLHNFYKTTKRKRSLLNEEVDQLMSSHDIVEEQTNIENKAIARKLLSTTNITSVSPNFEDVENEILSNDVVSKALGTDVCRYCVSKCPEK